MQGKEKPKQSKLKIFTKVILMIAIFVGLFFAVIGIGDLNDLVDRLSNMDTKYLLITIGLTILYLIFMILPHFFIAIFQKIKVDKTRIFLNASNEYFFNGITPAQGGSQPVQSYIYLKHGATGDEASSIVTTAYINYQLVASILSTAALIILVAFHQNVLQGKLAIVIIGFALNFLVLIIIFALTFSHKFPKFLQRFLYWLAKIKPFKAKLTKIADDTPQIVRKFQTSTRGMLKKKRFLIFTTLLRIIALLLYYLIPYYVAKALRVDIGPNDLIFIMSISLVATTLMAWFPLPGSSGGVEAVFVLMFTTVPVIDQNAAMSIMFVWRLFTFYFAMVWGISAYGIMKLIDYRKAKRAKVYQKKIENNLDGKLKVAIICDNFHENDDAQEIYDQLLKDGHQPYILTHSKHENNPDNTIYLKINRLKIFKNLRLNSLFHLRNNYKQFRKEDFDVVHAVNSLFHVRLIGKIKKDLVIPIFVTETEFSQEYVSHNFLNQKNIYFRLEKLLHQADRVLPRNVDNTYFYHFHNFKPSFVIEPTLLDGDEILNIKPESNSNEVLDKQFKNRYLLFFMNFEFDRFIDFYFGIKEQSEVFKDTQFIIVGNLKLTSGLKNSLEKNNLVNNFIFINNIDEVINELHNATGYIKEHYAPHNSIFYIVALANHKSVLLPESIKLPSDIKDSANVYLYSYFNNFNERIIKANERGYQDDKILENYYNEPIGKRLGKLYIDVAKEK